MSTLPLPPLFLSCLPIVIRSISRCRVRSARRHPPSSHRPSHSRPRSNSAPHKVTSSGRPQRFSNVPCRRRCRSSHRSSGGGSTSPGATAFARTVGAKSSASCRVKGKQPCFAHRVRQSWATAPTPTGQQYSRSRRRPRASIFGAQAIAHIEGAVNRHARHPLPHRHIIRGKVGVLSKRLALLTIISTPPNSCRNACAIVCTSSQSATSHCTARPRTPNASPPRRSLWLAARAECS